MQKINKLMILAAGRGSRMKELTNEVPKPLIKVNGKCLIDYVIDRAVEADITDLVVNVSYLGDKLVEHLGKRKDVSIEFSYEEERLETGGGVKKALPMLGKEPFFVANSDPLWVTDENKNLFIEMNEKWDRVKDHKDMMLMFQPVKTAYGMSGRGDYQVIDDNTFIRNVNIEDDERFNFIYGGVQIIKPKVFDDCDEEVFSLVKVFDKLEKNNKLGYFNHKGEWFHVGTPDMVKFTEDCFRKLNENKKCNIRLGRNLSRN